ncbi:hypothetical protein AB3S75_044298 [Citrus x aurantiifolia]
MALWLPRPSPFSSLLLGSRQHTKTAIPRPFISKALTSNNSSSVSVSRIYSHPSLQTKCSSSSSSNSTESDTSSRTGIFIKGLPESMTEGRVKKAFSQFGEVVQVKIVTEKLSKQPLGSAFVWFSRKESADLAVENMNGKFFYGRFILVKIAEPGLSKNRGRRTRYKF